MQYDWTDLEREIQIQEEHSRKRYQAWRREDHVADLINRFLKQQLERDCNQWLKEEMQRRAHRRLGDRFNPLKALAEKWQPDIRTLVAEYCHIALPTDKIELASMLFFNNPKMPYITWEFGGSSIRHSIELCVNEDNQAGDFAVECAEPGFYIYANPDLDDLQKGMLWAYEYGPVRKKTSLENPDAIGSFWLMHLETLQT